MKAIRRLICLLSFVGCAMVASPEGDTALEPGLVNPGYHEHPQWFKVSFLDMREDVAEAAQADKRVILYFFQDSCPYCAELLREGFADRAIVELVRKHFDVVAINIWGDREVTDFLGEPTTEKAFAADLKVQFTPTMLLLEQGKIVLRIDGYFPPHRLRIALRYVAERREQWEEGFRDFYLSLNPKAATGKLHREGGFLTRRSSWPTTAWPPDGRWW